jgi:putative colanic acid biosynthesis acetyltransferase WcaF
MILSAIQLSTFHNEWFRPGRSRSWQAAWFFMGLPFVRCAVIPFSLPRVWVLWIFGAKIGSGVVIKPGLRVKYPWKLTVGDHCWLGEDCWIDNLADVVVKNDVCISQGAYLCTGNHDWSDPAFGLRVAPIMLDEGSWVGARALIAPGVTLGEGSIAAAGSVITRSIPPYEIHSGNPATMVRARRLSREMREGGVTASQL